MPEIFDDWSYEQFDNAAAPEAGRNLWNQEVQFVQQGRVDDRPLYWRRLAEREHREQFSPQGQAEFERASRGFDDLTFSEDADLRILVTGFDPFRLDDHLTQSNPSGYVALRLAGQQWSTPLGKAEIRTCIVPVRYPDFDAGLIESLMEQVNADKPVELLVTVSMGRTDFDLERFPGRRRSVEGPDNLGLMSGGSLLSPAVPPFKGGQLGGEEFVEFSLPVEAMTEVEGPYAVNDNRVVTTLQRETFEAHSLAELTGETSVSGSGGGYLSNEISYRVINWCNQNNIALKTGHVHTPKMAGYDKKTLEAISEQTIALIRRAVLAATAEGKGTGTRS